MELRLYRNRQPDATGTRAAVLDHARALRVGAPSVPLEVERHRLAAAAAQRVVLARGARLVRLPPGTERAEGVLLPPVGAELIEARPAGRAGREAARRELAAGAGADQEVARDAAVDRELLEHAAVRPVMDQHRRVGAVDADPDAVPPRRRRHQRPERPVLRVRAGELGVGGGAAPGRLEAEQLDLVEAAPA